MSSPDHLYSQRLHLRPLCAADEATYVSLFTMPNIMAPLITLATLSVGNAILASATLSFLGLGVPPDVPDWGQMLNTEARSFMTKAWWLAVFGFNMLGDALRDLLDPRLRTGS